jgi:ribokinase
MIFVAESGQNEIVVLPGANNLYTPEDLHADEHQVATAQWCLLQLEIPVETVVAAARTSKRHGARVLLDPAPAPPSLPPELLASTDILTPNATEAACLIGERVHELTVDEARAVGGRLVALGVRTVIIKLGAQGCVLVSRDDTTWIPAPQVDAVDTTAAGDVFNGALAVACSEGGALIDACRFAVRAASLSVTRLGAQRSMPDRDELTD